MMQPTNRSRFSSAALSLAVVCGSLTGCSDGPQEAETYFADLQAAADEMLGSDMGRAYAAGFLAGSKSDDPPAAPAGRRGSAYAAGVDLAANLMAREEPEARAVLEHVKNRIQSGG